MPFMGGAPPVMPPLLDCLHEGVMICGPDSRIVEANAAACRFLGRARAELVGKSAGDDAWGLVHVDHTPFAPGDHPADRAIATGEMVGDVPLGVARSQGGAVWGLVAAFPQFGSQGQLTEVVVTITEPGSGTPAEGLFDGGGGLAAVFSSIPVGIVASRASDHVYIDANQAFLSMFGYTRDEVVGHSAAELGTWAEPAHRERIGTLLSAGRRIVGEELKYRTKSGETRCGLASMEVVPLGGELCIMTFINDITDRMAAEEALRESEERYRLIADNAGDVVWLLNTSTQAFEYVSPSVERLRGYSLDEVLRQRLDEVMTPESFDLVVSGLPDRLRAFAAGDESARTQTHEVLQTRKDGSTVPTEVVTTLITNTEGRVTHIQGVTRDISERKKVEEELRFRETLLEETGRLAHVGGWWFDAETGEGSWTDEVAHIHDLDPMDPTSRDSAVLYYVDESRARVEKAIADAISNAVPYDLELEMVTAKGVRKWVHTIGRPVVKDGRVAGLRGSFQDISERKRSEDELRSSEERFSRAFHSSPVAQQISTVAGGAIIDVNQAYCRLAGCSRDDLIGRTLLDARLIIEEGWQPLLEEYGRVGRVANAEVKLRIPSGALRTIAVSVEPIELLGEQCIISSALDITGRLEAEAALQKSEARFRALVDAAPQGIFVQRDGEYRYMNPAMARILGAERPEDLLGANAFDRIASTHREAARERVAARLDDESAAMPVEDELVRLDGSLVPVEVVGVNVTFEGLDSQLVFARDLTAERQAGQERSALEAQLRQSQKMESIGRLAGGVAHDFNNILMVQKGYCELLQGSLRPDDPLAQSLGQIEACTERAAALTRQLLAFSRKQALDPKVLDINLLVQQLEDMLRRLVGEDVEFQIALADAPGMVKADPGQMEQVLVNLAVNARDAMPDGGRLIIAVALRDVDAHQASAQVGLSAGPHVVLSVTDTGLGMDEITRSMIFEPFFTTKPEGKGTGLGLSTVYGIVTQSGGSIRVMSKPGRGSTFEVYLPLAEGEPVSVASTETAIESGRGQLVLLVEDEAALRQLAVAMLTRLGYEAVAAENGGAALMLVEEQGLRPALVVTDVIMPGINGKVLVERLRRSLPGLRAIYMSGYTGEVVAFDGVLEAGTAFLQKPFSLANLSEKMRSVLAGR